MHRNPDYGCKCLNVQVLASQPPQGSVPPRPQDAGFVWVFVDTEGVLISHEQLVQRVRNEQFGILVCRICFTFVGRVEQQKSNEKQQSSKGGSSPSRQGVNVDLFSRRPRWIQICTTLEGCLTGRSLETAIQRVSPIFNLIIPEREPESPIPASPTPSNQPLAEPVPRLTLPELFPPPPFVPNHAVFSHLSRVAKKQSASIREQAERDVAAYIESKRREVAEQENVLKSQVHALWKAWKETQDQELPKVMPAKISMSQHPATVIRDFSMDSAPPRSRMAMATSAPVFSALSTSMRQSRMYVPQQQPAIDELSPEIGFDETPTASPNRTRFKHGNATPTAGSSSQLNGSGSSLTQSRSGTGSVRKSIPQGVQDSSASTKKKKAVTFEKADSTPSRRDIKQDEDGDDGDDAPKGDDDMFDMDEEEANGVANTSKADLSQQNPEPIAPLRPINGVRFGSYQGPFKSSNMTIGSLPNLGTIHDAASNKGGKSLFTQDLMALTGGNTPTHRSAWLRGQHPLYKNMTGRAIDELREDDDESDDDNESEEDIPPSTSIPISVPRMRPTKAVEQSLQATLSKSVDPGPALELEIARSRSRTAQDMEDDEHDAAIALQPGRASVRAQRILERP